MFDELRKREVRFKTTGKRKPYNLDRMKYFAKEITAGELYFKWPY